MARRLNPFTGSVDEVDDAVAGFYDEWWARLGDFAAHPLGLPPETSDLADGSLAATLSLARAETPKEAELALRGTAAATQAWNTATGEHGTPEPERRTRRKRSLIVPWTAATCAKVREGLPSRYQAMADVGQGLGLRLSEMSALAVEDLERGSVLVRRQVKRAAGTLVWAPPKAGSSGCLPLDRHLKATLDGHLARFGTAAVTLPWDTADGTRETFRLLFAGVNGTPLDRSYFTRIWRTAVSAAGMTPGRTNGTHQLRHHFASELVAKGTDLETVRRLLRHADLLTTQTYIHSLAISDAQSRKAVAKVTPKPARRKPGGLPSGVADFGAYRNRRHA